MTPPNRAEGGGRGAPPTDAAALRESSLNSRPAGERLGGGLNPKRLWGAHRRLRLGRWPALLLAALFLSGCVTMKDPEGWVGPGRDDVARLDAQHSVGQSFVSRRPRLNGLSVWMNGLEAPADPSALLRAELFHLPGDALPIWQQYVPVETVRRERILSLSFSPLPDPPDTHYYLRLSVPGGAFQVLGRDEDAYPDGELWIADGPQDADMAFQQTYDYDGKALLGDVGRALQGGRPALALVAMLYLPGWLLLRLFARRLRLDWGERTAISIGLSLAFTALLFLWSGAVGWRWREWGIWGLYGVLAAVWLAVAQWRIRAWLRAADGLPHRRLRADGISLALAAVFVFSLGLRLVMARDLAAPVWIDSVHHLFLIRLVMENGALPHTYAPLIETLNANYHAGFHASAAVFTWLSGLDAAKALLLLGQALNALSVFLIYLLTTTLTQQRLAGLMAAIAVGVFSPLPAFYLAWGRYTQLAGLLILPAAFRLLLETMSAPRLRWGVMSAAAAASAGVFLVHYRVVMFLALLIVAYLVSSTIIHLAARPLWRSLPAWIGRIGIVAAGAMLLASPWFIMVTRTIIAPLAAGGHAPPTPLDSLPWGYLDPASGRAVYILALLGLAYSALRARWFGLMLTLWTALLYLSANKGVVALPGMGGVNQNSVDIVLFIPLCILAGWVVGDGLMTLASRLPVRWRWSLAGAVVIAVSGLAIIGAQRLIPLVGPTTVLIRQADLPALAWAEAHLPADAEVLINPFLWGYGIYAGQDGGYYLTPLAGRATVPPPVLYAEGPRPRIETILEISRQVENLGRDAPGLRRLMDAHGLTHVFLGRRGGVISPKALKQSDLFEVIYDHDGVTIFKTH